MKCKKCGTELDAAAKYCEKCGQKVNLEEKTVSEQKNGKKSTLVGVTSAIVFILALGVGRWLTQDTFSPSTDSSSRDFTNSKSELINEAVKEAKASVTFPYKSNETTTWIDITAESNAIRYYYVLSGSDASDFTNDLLKSYLTSGVCQTAETRNLLDRGINMEYSYAVENSIKNFFVSVSKTDCIQ